MKALVIATLIAFISSDVTCRSAQRNSPSVIHLTSRKDAILREPAISEAIGIGHLSNNEESEFPLSKSLYLTGGERFFEGGLDMDIPARWDGLRRIGFLRPQRGRRGFQGVFLVTHNSALAQVIRGRLPKVLNSNLCNGGFAGLDRVDAGFKYVNVRPQLAFAHSNSVGEGVLSGHPKTNRRNGKNGSEYSQPKRVSGYGIAASLGLRNILAFICTFAFVGGFLMLRIRKPMNNYRANDPKIKYGAENDANKWGDVFRS